MSTVIFVIHLLVTICLITVVLLQRSESAGFNSQSSGLLSVRGQANLLTRLTAILAAIFFLTSITLAILARNTHEQKSIFTQPATNTTPIAEPVKQDTTTPSTPEAKHPEKPATPKTNKTTNKKA